MISGAEVRAAAVSCPASSRYFAVDGPELAAALQGKCVIAPVSQTIAFFPPSDDVLDIVELCVRAERVVSVDGNQPTHGSIAIPEGGVLGIFGKSIACRQNGLHRGPVVWRGGVVPGRQSGPDEHEQRMQVRFRDSRGARRSAPAPGSPSPPRPAIGGWRPPGASPGWTAAGWCGMLRM